MIPDWLYSPLPMALLGAIPGAMRAYVATVAESGKVKAVADALIGVVFAAAVADWLTPPHYPMLALAIGMLAALTGAKILDASKELVSEALRELVLGWIRRNFGSSYGGGHYPPRPPHLPRPPRDYRRDVDNPDEVDDADR